MGVQVPPFAQTKRQLCCRFAFCGLERRSWKVVNLPARELAVATVEGLTGGLQQVVLSSAAALLGPANIIPVMSRMALVVSVGQTSGAI